MDSSTIHSTEAAEHIRRLEELLEAPVVCLVVATSRRELAFVIPAQSSEAYVRTMLKTVAAACQDASKSL